MSAREDYIELFKYMNCRIKPDININNTLSRLKEHMINNPNDSTTRSIKDWLYNNIKFEFLNPYLERALNMDNNLPFTKIINIYNKLPFINNYIDFKFYFYSLINVSDGIGTTRDFYNACKKFYEEYQGELTTDIFDRVIDFCDNNASIMNNSPISYRPSEIKRIVCKPNGDYIGDYGEQYIFNILSNSGDEVFLLPNNGFGYDILSTSYDKETLIEVKSIMGKVEKDNSKFKITINEKRILDQTLNLPNTEYVIARVYFDNDYNPCSYVILHYDKDNDCFYSDDDPNYNICYTKSLVLKGYCANNTKKNSN